MPATPLVAAAGAEYAEFETPGSALERRAGLATSERTMALRIGEDKFRFFMVMSLGLDQRRFKVNRWLTRIVGDYLVVVSLAFVSLLAGGILMTWPG